MSSAVKTQVENGSQLIRTKDCVKFKFGQNIFVKHATGEAVFWWKRLRYR